MEAFSSSVCRTCRVRLSIVPPSRSFSTTSHRRIIPPESPAYIDVPASHQAKQPYAPPQKGLLPVPRELFPAKRPDKPSQQYLDNVTKSPLPHNVKPKESLTRLGKHRVRMSELRKQHLREGLTELHERKQQTTSRMEYISHARQAQRSRLVSQPEREDSRLTSASVPAALKHVKSSTPIADDLAAAKALYETKKANYERAVGAKEGHRLDALHTLYMNAREFITTQEQLEDAITQQFDEQSFMTDTRSGKSIWNHGSPDTIKDMIKNAKGLDPLQAGSNKYLGDFAVRQTYLKDQARLKKIAEKLSGGKI